MKGNIKIKVQYKQRVAKEKIEEGKAKPLYGQFGRYPKSPKTLRSWNWLARGDLKPDTEALLVTARHQALNTLSVQKEIYHTATSDKF